jgi:hypothetical protein
MYFFVFEMKSYQDTIEAQDLEDNLNRAKRTNRIKWVVFATFVFLVAAPAYAVVIAVNFDFEHYLPNAAVYDGLVTIRGIAKFAIDIYMFPRFYYTFFFFVKAKRAFIKRYWGP